MKWYQWWILIVVVLTVPYQLHTATPLHAFYAFLGLMIMTSVIMIPFGIILTIMRRSNKRSTSGDFPTTTPPPS